MQQTYVMKPIPESFPSGTDLASYINSYTGANSNVVYYDDKNGNIIYAEDISKEQNNYIDATNKIILHGVTLNKYT